MASLVPSEVSHFKKRKFLSSLTEDEFRDRVIRPLMARRGFRHYRETCGPTEEGKDCIFLFRGPLGIDYVYAVQTKRGNLNMSASAKSSISDAIAQLRTAREAEIHVTEHLRKQKPDFVLLCASGTVNDPARRFIAEQLRDQAVTIWDVDAVIQLIDDAYHELWFGVDANRMPYVRKLRTTLLDAIDIVIPSAMGTDGSQSSPVTDEAYANVYLQRLTHEVKRRRGEATKIPKLEQLPAQSVLGSKSSLILISGDGGSGKTTSLRRIAFLLCERASQNAGTAQLPVLIRANDLAPESASIVDRAAAETQSISNSDAPAFGIDDLHSGALVLLIDALDEVPRQQDRLRVLDKCIEFAKCYPACKVVVTSRLSRTTLQSEQAKHFERYDVSPIDLKQARKIIDCATKGKAISVSSCQETLRRLQDVHGVSLTPMLVAVFAASSDAARSDIPPNITEIFAKFTELMLGRWDERKGMKQQYHAQVKNFLVQRIGYLMHKERVSFISLDRCKAIIADELAKRGLALEIEVLTEEILSRSGLFRRDDESTIGFRHQLFQEYFAGCAITDGDDLSILASDEWWRMPLVFRFGSKPGESGRLDSLLSSRSLLSAAASFEATITAGLCVQACYLVETKVRVEFLRRVFTEIARCGDGFVQMLLDDIPKVPIAAFVSYYVRGRDAVACGLVRHLADDIRRAIGGAGQGELTDSARRMEELKIFWMIAAMIESGDCQGALPLVREFRPDDPRLLIAIHMGAFYVAHRRISEETQRDAAGSICRHLEPFVSPWREQFYKEFDSVLLEVQRGHIKALDAPKPGEENPESE